MTSVFVVRPEPGNAGTLAAARALGLAAEGWPLFEVRALDWSPPEEPVDAILASSANAFRQGGAGLNALRHLAVHAVGETTAQAARAAGFAVAATGGGGLQELVSRFGPARLLRLAGRERVTLTPPPGVTLTERVVYASEPVPIPAALAARLAHGGTVLLHSALAAEHFARECRRLGIPRAELSLAAIGRRVAAAAGSGWRTAASAPCPDDAALLALAAQLCQ